MKSTCVIVVYFLFSQFFNAQNLKTATIKIPQMFMSSLEGDATYQYYEDENHNNIRNGKFNMTANNKEEIYLMDGEYQQFKLVVAGNYKDGLKNGLWTFTVTENNLLNGYNEYRRGTMKLTANFKDGIPHGQWTYADSYTYVTFRAYKLVPCSKPSTQNLTATFKNGKLVGTLNYKQTGLDPQTQTYTFDDESFITSYTNKNVENETTITFKDHFLLKSVSKNLETGKAFVKDFTSEINDVTSNPSIYIIDSMHYNFDILDNCLNAAKFDFYYIDNDYPHFQGAYYNQIKKVTLTNIESFVKAADQSLNANLVNLKPINFIQLLKDTTSPLEWSTPSTYGAGKWSEVDKKIGSYKQSIEYTEAIKNYLIKTNGNYQQGSYSVGFKDARLENFDFYLKSTQNLILRYNQEILKTQEEIAQAEILAQQKKTQYRDSLFSEYRRICDAYTSIEKAQRNTVILFNQLIKEENVTKPEFIVLEKAFNLVNADLQNKIDSLTHIIIENKYLQTRLWQDNLVKVIPIEEEHLKLIKDFEPFLNKFLELASSQNIKYYSKSLKKVTNIQEIKRIIMLP